MSIPRRMSVRVVEAASGRPLEGILVFFNLQALGQDAFGGLVGLTDMTGHTALTDSELREQYQENQRAFPMDYKMKLEDYDSCIVVGVDGDDAFVQHQRAAMTSPLVAASARRLWAQARNRYIRRAAAKAEYAIDSEAVTVVLPVEPVL